MVVLAYSQPSRVHPCTGNRYIHKCLLNIKNEKSTLNSIEKRTKKVYNKRDMITNEEHKDRIKEYAKQWKQDNPSMVWVQKQEYFEKNKDKINEHRRCEYAENKEAKNSSVWNNFHLFL